MRAAVAGSIGIAVALSPFLIALVARQVRRRAARVWLARARLERARNMTGEQMGHEPLVRIAEGIVDLAWRKSGRDRP
ncbi:hypothetical protein [Streptomyces sp. SP17KL33]|uniref:hypothetical protein n=1 Tax=Streptomyces sp. SP17KL33 TaxID=3002534 RepID=UPI002E762599|nr:hypothetical protein [Streptomyces sp. SP17KL33]MEE1838125.1 hypothetical protein [Streptomyces sp. SP17KL33]